MSNHFTMHRVLCSTPPELESARLVFEQQLSDFAEQVTMPAGILFPSASFRQEFNVSVLRYAVESNIRMVEFFLQIFGGSMPDPVFQGFINLSLACVADPAIPLRQATVLFKHSSGSPELEKLREALAADSRCEVREYADEQDLGLQIRNMLEGWFALVRP
jgi:hypothetical protein